MTEITTELVKALRDKTGAGMMDCKKALTESNGDMDLAIDWLRKKGLSAAAKKSDRVASEGLVGVAVAGNKAAIVEINSETDFVARNDSFKKFVKDVAKIALNGSSDVEALKNSSMEGSTVADNLTKLIATIGENMSLRRVEVINSTGFVYSYLHNSEEEGVGKIGVLLTLDKDNPTFGKQIAMHIAAMSPKSLSPETLDKSLIEHEKQLQREMAATSGKPADIIEKMLEGRIRKYYEEVCLLEQAFVMSADGEKVSAVAKKNGLEIKGFVRFELGEGISKKQENFAEEVAKAAQ